jgi:cytochrome c-type biogenesis protein CcmH
MIMVVLLAMAGTGWHPTCMRAKPDRFAEDEVTERRLLAISSELRCLVCQNESLAGSNAELANDLRREIRSLIRDGRSDAEIMEFMVSRYGDFVRYRPPLKGSTLLLWFGPGLLFVTGLTALVIYLRRRDQAIKEHAADGLPNNSRAEALLQDRDTRQGQP